MKKIKLCCFTVNYTHACIIANNFINNRLNNVKVIYINEKNEEILYRVTDISLEYLSNEDVESLKQGIDVYGIQNLNQLIEDFE